MTVMEFRARTRQPDDLMDDRWQKLAVDTDYSLLLTGEVRVLKPDGKLLAHYIPGAFSRERMNEFYDTLHELRKYETSNRGYASGTEAIAAFKDSTRFRTAPIASAIIGSFDAQPPKHYCRLTAFSGKDFDKYSTLFPMFRDIGALFSQTVPERYAVQMDYVNATNSDWVIPGTPFTTITVNNSYPTGYHTDKGDLDEGFSCLTVLRKGDYVGGRLVFPEYRVAVDMGHGDQLFMDAHAAHGNTQLVCGDCGVPMGPGAGTDYSHEAHGCTAERISVVSYYRTKMKECGSAEEEQRKAQAWAEKRATINEERLAADVGLVGAKAVEEMAEEAVGG